MPIAREYRGFYGRQWKLETRPRIIERAGNCCERCGIPHGAEIWILPGGKWWDPDWKHWRAPASILVDLRPPKDRGLILEATADPSFNFPDFPLLKRQRIQCGVAHINHQPGDDRPENLAYWCRSCHLEHDKSQHRNTRCVRKDRSRPLIAMISTSQ